MILSRPSRLVAALIVLCSVLFMQLAVAGYACPGHTGQQDQEVKTMDGDVSMSSCEGMDTSQPNLCHAHEQVGNQSLDKPPTPHVEPFVASILTVVFQALILDPAPITSPPADILLTRSTSPPLAIRNCCFRI